MTDYSVFEQSLEKLADMLDISDSAYDRIETSYKTLGKWFCRDESDIKVYAPEIYTQGSFRLGTVIRPFSDEEDYDIDLVCQLNSPDVSVDRISQKMLKEMVGKEIGLYAKSQKMHPPEEKKRCWGLYYRVPKYHLDTLPALPVRTTGEKTTRIVITDKTKRNYGQIHSDWESSDPIGYAVWFRKRMEIQFDAKRKQMAFVKNARVEEIPEYRVKTPLQRAIQILKRHRDIMFQDAPDKKPISIIIATLAAQAYNNEAGLSTALKTIVNNMEQYITQKDDVDWVKNPVNPQENFAEKWGKDKVLKRNFFEWTKAAKIVFLNMERSETFDDVTTVMNSAFGSITTDKVASFLHQQSRTKSIPITIKSQSPQIMVKPWKQ